MNLFKFFTTLILSLSILSSCSDDDAAAYPFNGMNGSLPIRIANSTYSYDNNNRLTKILWKIDDVPETGSSVHDFFYNAQGQIDKMDYKTYGSANIFRTTAYEYKDNIITYTTTDGNDVVWGTGTITLNSNKMVINHTYTSFTVFETDNKLVSYEYDFQGRISKTTTNEHDPSYTTYEYDNKNGIYANINLPQWFLVTQLNVSEKQIYNYINNCTKITKHSENGDGYETFDYEYNKYNFPYSFVYTNKSYGDIEVIPPVRYSVEYK